MSHKEDITVLQRNQLPSRLNKAGSMRHTWSDYSRRVTHVGSFSKWHPHIISIHIAMMTSTHDLAFNQNYCPTHQNSNSSGNKGATLIQVLVHMLRCEDNTNSFNIILKHSFGRKMKGKAWRWWALLMNVDIFDVSGFSILYVRNKLLKLLSCLVIC